ncbi:ABC transporter ATP-binding protein [bacterium]|nr:ABC transporter ATP-binding protein [bacterium]
MTKQTLLRVENLHTEFRTLFGVVKAVRGISFEISPGETIGIVGESGCGKSVTGLSILNLIPNPPGLITQGSIWWEKEDLLKIPRKQWLDIRGNKISMIFQDPMSSLNPVLTIRTQMKEILQYHTQKTAVEIEAECISLLNKVRIRKPKEVLSQYPHQLSGGMRQRIMIAIAIACHPDLIIADEPTTSLDVTVQAQMIDLLRDIQVRTNTAILLITHNLAVVAGMCQRVLVFYAGKIVEDSAIDDLFAHPLHPYTMGLLKAVPRLTSLDEEPLATIPGSPPDLIALPTGCTFHPRCQFAMQICAIEEPTLQTVKGRKVACWLYDPRNPGRLAE